MKLGKCSWCGEPKGAQRLGENTTGWPKYKCNRCGNHYTAGEIGEPWDHKGKPDETPQPLLWLADDHPTQEPWPGCPERSPSGRFYCCLPDGHDGYHRALAAEGESDLERWKPRHQLTREVYMRALRFRMETNQSRNSGGLGGTLPTSFRSCLLI